MCCWSTWVASGVVGWVVVGCAHEALQQAERQASPAPSEGRAGEDVEKLRAALAVVDERLRRGPAPGPEVEEAGAMAQRLGLARADLLGALYAERQQRPAFVDGPEFGAAGKAVLEYLLSAHEHGLDANAFGGPALERELAASSAAAVPASALEWTEEEVAAMGAVLAGAPDMSPDALADRVLSGSAGPPSAKARLAWQLAVERQMRSDATWRERELRLVHGLFELALALRSPVDPEGETDDLARQAEARQSAVEARLTALFQEIVHPAASVRKILAALEPPFEQYGRLKRAFARYRDFCAGGVWATIGKGPELSREKSSEGERVAALRERLRSEGYYQGQAGLHGFDDDLHAAVVKYQETHQFTPTGKVDKGLVESLDVPCAERLAQIGVTMAKWRESRIAEPKGRYVFINIPDFHGELWDQGERVHRFKVITGMRSHSRRRDGTRIFKYATPELSSKMRHVVFNPYWNVPESIRLAEIEPEIAKDPDYLAKHNFEVVDKPDGTNYFRQRPGPGNALGRVKFLFPNPYDVYLHDTPTKKKFAAAVRAFSHGCMRVENPLELARLVLERDGNWRDSYRHRSEELQVNLQMPIGVHVEYYVVRVDDEGWVHFNTDVYYRDEGRLATWLSAYPTGAPPVARHDATGAAAPLDGRAER